MTETGVFLLINIRLIVIIRKKEVTAVVRENRSSAASLLGSAHFFVDFACTALLTVLSSKLPYMQVIACAILYNGLAFAFQLPIGALSDLLGLHRNLAAVGCLLVALGSLFSQPILLCVLIGLGNACFHVGGGREALKRGKGTAAFPGRFVAPGAIGIFLGPRLAGFAWLTRGVLPVILLGLAVLLFLTQKQGRQAERLTAAAIPLPRRQLAAMMACMFLTVLLRSYMGTVLRYSFLSHRALAFCFTLSIFAGKYFGGILADRFGALRFSAIAQTVCTALFILSVWVPLLALPAIFLFNTTMAITAAGLYRCLPRYPGTMFGLTTFALYLGVLPKLLGWENIFFNWWGLGLLGLLSATLLLGGLILGRGGIAHGSAADQSGSVAGADAAP